MTANYAFLQQQKVCYNSKYFNLQSFWIGNVFMIELYRHHPNQWTFNLNQQMVHKQNKSGIHYKRATSQYVCQVD